MDEPELAGRAAAAVGSGGRESSVAVAPRSMSFRASGTRGGRMRKG